MKLRAAAIVPVLAFASPASAEVPHCTSADANLAYVQTDLAELGGDTGWFPNGYAAQLRISGRVTGKTRVEMGLAPTACWGEGMNLTAPGRATTGLLDSEYGAELHVLAQIHTTVLGVHIDWNGEIPLPYVPSDLIMAANTTFDPTLLPGAAQTSVSVSDQTGRVKLISTNVLSDIIDITGISGGLSLYVKGQMATSYATKSITLGEGAITAPDGSVAHVAPESGFGTALALPLQASGTVTYAPSLVFDVTFDVRILGITVVNYTLASVTLPLSSIDRQVDLTGDGVNLPLAHIEQAPASLGFASGATQTLTLKNTGSAPLVVETVTAPAGVTATSATIEPGTTGTLTVTAADASAVSGSLVLATSDPNHVQLSVELDAQGSGQSNGDGGGEHSGGCAAGNGAGLLPLLGIAALLLRRRR